MKETSKNTTNKKKTIKEEENKANIPPHTAKPIQFTKERSETNRKTQQKHIFQLNLF